MKHWKKHNVKFGHHDDGGDGGDDDDYDDDDDGDNYGAIMMMMMMIMMIIIIFILIIITFIVIIMNMIISPPFSNSLLGINTFNILLVLQKIVFCIERVLLKGHQIIFSFNFLSPAKLMKCSLHSIVVYEMIYYVCSGWWRSCSFLQNWRDLRSNWWWCPFMNRYYLREHWGHGHG